ncbi:hypothetical protein TWF696_008899 [Orbilia brochopaga]|uniref:Uncharacterized protein n=1 Tax=Orbilia brochopaga TaxID=3140254 RepID=A0AAV9UFZ2_9PEZI
MSQHVFKDPAILKGYFGGLAQGPLNFAAQGNRVPKPCKGNNYLFGTAIMNAAAVEYNLKDEDKTSKTISERRDSVVAKTTQAKICKDLELKELFEKTTQQKLPEQTGVKSLARISQTYAAAVHRDCRNDPARFTAWAGGVFDKYMKDSCKGFDSPFGQSGSTRYYGTATKRTTALTLGAKRGLVRLTCASLPLPLQVGLLLWQVGTK